MVDNYDEMMRECERAGSFENWARQEYAPSQCYDISEGNSDGPIYTYQQMALFMEFALNRCQLQEWYDLAEVGESFTDPMKMMEAQVLGAVNAVCGTLWSEYLFDAESKLNDEVKDLWFENLNTDLDNGIKWRDLESVFESLTESPDCDLDDFLRASAEEAYQILLKRV